MINKSLIEDKLEIIREKKPLIHCITNYVTANDCANIILAIGGIPTMAHYKNEVEEIASKAQALVINIGTLSEESVEAMILAGKAANKNNIPVIFDPVGVAATKFRKESAFKILDKVKVSVIRGNMAEIKVLLGMQAISKGVDSIEILNYEDSKEIAISAAEKFESIVVITGKKDYISNGKDVYVIENGTEMMTQITGAGCMTTALIGTFLGSIEDEFLASIIGVMAMGVAGEIACEKIKKDEASGSFRVRLIDAVNMMTSKELRKRGRING